MKKIRNEERIIDINKNNYKGYVELYGVQQFLTIEKNKSNVKSSKMGMLTFLIGAIVVGVALPISLIIALVVTIALGIYVSTFTFFNVKRALQINKERYQKLREKYPYVDTEIKKEALEKSLEEVGIIHYEHINGVCIVTLKVKSLVR